MFVQIVFSLLYTYLLIHVENRSIFFSVEIEFDTDKGKLFNNSSDAIFCERTTEEKKKLKRKKEEEEEMQHIHILSVIKCYLLSMTINQCLQWQLGT